LVTSTLLAFRRLLVCRADLDKFRLGRNLGFHVRVKLGRIAIRVGASIGIRAHVGKEEFVVSGTFGALDAASGGWDKLRVAFVEWRLFQEQENVMLNPLLQMPHWKQDALGLGSGPVPLLPKAIGECLFLLGWLQFGKQERVAYADFLGIERLDHWRGKFGQTDSLRAICRALSDLRGDLLDTVLRVFQVEQCFESLRFL
jgi:hypothetical protein